MNKVAYVAAFDFDNAEAAKNRFLSLCNVLEKNFQVTKVLTTYPIDKLYDDKTENWKIRFVKNKSIQNLFLVFILSYYIIKNAKRFDIFIIYGGYAFYMLPFILLKPFFNYKIVYDSVEIYLPMGLMKSIFSPSRWNHIFGYDFLIRFFDGAICISSFIQQKHQNQGLKTVIVPPIFLNENHEIDLKEEKHRESNNKHKILFYGFPAKKDSLYNLVKVFIQNKSLSEKFEVTIIGLNDNQYIKYCHEHGIYELPNNFIIKGKLGLERVYEELKETDFTFLQRPYTIATKAGFPSKLAESLFFKIPSVLNLTSDMEKYEIDKCSLVCEDNSLESLNKVLIFLQNMKKIEIDILKDNCKIIYEKYFSIEANRDKINSFILDVNKKSI